jgi:hypothetical protein
VKDVKRMTIEILKGCKFGDPRSFIPVNYDNLQSWKQLETQVAEIHAKGGVVDLRVSWWARRDSNPRPPPCQGGALAS